MQRKILILGSEGLIGSKISRYFMEEDFFVESFDLLTGHDFTKLEVLESILKNSDADVLINVFGIDYSPDETSLKLGLRQSMDNFEKDFALNVITTYASCRLFIESRQSGSIINFSSIYGLVSPNPRLYDGGEKPIYYGVSKAAIIQMSKHLAVHHAPRFRINVVAPGGILDKQAFDFVEKYNSSVPMQRMGSTEDLIPAIHMLAKAENNYMTGSVIVVDGGWTSL